MAPTAAQVLAAVKRSGAKYELCDGWDDPKIQASGHWDPQYVIQHHTANGGAHGNSPSLAWVLHDPYFPIRGCHFLIGRDGIIHVVYALKCYHAGKGGPGAWGGGPKVPKDSMNGYAYGIEIESKGTSLVVTDVDGITAAQYDSLARLNAVLLDLIDASSAGRIINHRTWAPGRKTDTRDSDAHLQAITRTMRADLAAAHTSTGGGGQGTGVVTPPARLVTLHDLTSGEESPGAALINHALASEGFLANSLVRSYVGVAAGGAFRVYRWRRGFKKDSLTALRALGARHGFTVA